VQLENDDMEVDMMEVDPPGADMQLVIFNQENIVLVQQNPPDQEAVLNAPNFPGSPAPEEENVLAYSLLFLTMPLLLRTFRLLMRTSVSAQLIVPSGSEGEGVVGIAAQLAPDLTLLQTNVAIS
jgi:hypothetical protein